MNSTQTCLITGLILGTAAAIGGFLGFLIALVLGAIGLLIGRILDGELEVGDMLGKGRDK